MIGALQASVPTIVNEPLLFGLGEVQVNHNLWYSWARVAVGHLGATRDARDRRLEGTPISMNRELYDAMQSVTSVAFALDGWFGATYEALSARPRPGGAMTDRSLLDSMGKASTKPLSKKTQQSVQWLFGKPGARGTAVHHEPKFSMGAPHPTLASGVLAAKEYAEYSLETAQRAVDLLETVLSSVLHPKPALKPWLEGRRGVVLQILDIIRHDRTSSGPHIVGASVVAEILGVSRQRVHQLVQQGQLTPIDVAIGVGERDRMIVFERTDVELCRLERRARGIPTGSSRK